MKIGALVLPGEDRLFGGSHLFVDLIPSSCWFKNVRACVSGTDWDRLRRVVYARAGHRCEICGTAGRLDCHERWHYDERKGVQSLRRLIALCGLCHGATHIGFALTRGRGGQERRHIAKVNGWSAQDVEYHIEAAFEEWHRRNARKWTLDLAILENAGIRAAQSAEIRARHGH